MGVGRNCCEPLETTPPAHRQANKQDKNKSNKNVVNQTEAQGQDWDFVSSFLYLTQFPVPPFLVQLLVCFPSHPSKSFLLLLWNTFPPFLFLSLATCFSRLQLPSSASSVYRFLKHPLSLPLPPPAPLLPLATLLSLRSLLSQLFAENPQLTIPCLKDPHYCSESGSSSQLSDKRRAKTRGISQPICSVLIIIQ